MHIAICDDERAEIAYLKSLVQKWAAAENIELSTSEHESAESFLFSYSEDKSVDIILLDIQMKGMDGVTLAKQIRADNQRTQIIFITGYADFMSEGYEVSALHYLMKPVKEDKLRETLSRALSRLQQAPRTLLLPKSGGSIRIAATDIIYAEAFSHTVTLHTIGGRHDFNMRLADMEKLLGEGFFRCHRSYIVSLAHLRRVVKYALLLDDGRELPLSRSLYDAANQAFISYN